MNKRILLKKLKKHKKNKATQSLKRIVMHPSMTKFTDIEMGEMANKKLKRLIVKMVNVFKDNTNRIKNGIRK